MEGRIRLDDIIRDGRLTERGRSHLPPEWVPEVCEQLRQKYELTSRPPERDIAVDPGDPGRVPKPGTPDTGYSVHHDRVEEPVPIDPGQDSVAKAILEDALLARCEWAREERKRLARIERGHNR